jgi:hypothetical protein
MQKAADQQQFTANGLTVAARPVRSLHHILQIAEMHQTTAARSSSPLATDLGPRTSIKVYLDDPSS